MASEHVNYVMYLTPGAHVGAPNKNFAIFCRTDLTRQSLVSSVAYANKMRVPA